MRFLVCPSCGYRAEKQGTLAKVERNNRIVEMREEGQTFTAIAKEVGVSISRVREIYLRYVGRLVGHG